MAPESLNKDKEERVLAAVNDVKRGMKLSTASKLHMVPRNTVRNRLRGKPPARGPATILTGEEEQLLVDWIKDSARKGFPRRKLDLLLSVKEFLDKNKERATPFKDNMPGHKWYSSFLKRHPDLAKRTPEGVSRASGNVSEQDIRKWFRDIREVLKEENAEDALEDPDRVGNADETNFKLCPSKSLVLAGRGSKDVYEIDQGDAKSAVTAMFAYLASGKMVDPMLIFPYQRIPADLVKSVPGSWGIGRSESGWMTAETFYEWIGNIVGPFLTTNKIKLPFVLFVDGHKTHLTRDTSNLCKELGIVLIALYPNATHILQPCDVAAFRPLKAAWSKAVLTWRREHPHEALTKMHIAPILKIALQKDMIQTLKNGFRATGLHPFNPDAVNYVKCMGHQENNADALVEAPENPHPQKIISLNDFKRIVGTEVMTELVQDLDPDSECPSELALRRLYGSLTGTVEGEKPPAAEEERASPTSSLPVDLNIVRQEPHTDDGDDVDDPAEPRPGSSSAGPADLKDVLQWPHSPKRKGKRQTERMPFVITSKRWKAVQDAKEQQRQEQALQKELRAQQRRDKKAAKEAEMAEKTAARRRQAGQVAARPRRQQTQRK